MNPKLQRAFDDIERQREELLVRLRTLSRDRLTSAPQGKWSIIRILSHLITGERTGLEYVNKKILGIDTAGDTGLYEEFKMQVLVLSQRLPFLKYKAPKLIEERTKVFDTLEEVESEWIQLRKEWKAFLERIPDKHVKRKIFKHVVAGRLNVEHGLRFFG
ncbi:MAG TPA: DinB family protein, partial [Anaerolineales bacterium]|nr:DinB family protein [Anaerolineales bacterium]